MRIGIDARFYGVAGPGRYVSELVKHIVPLFLRNQLVLFVLPNKSLEIKQMMPGVEVIEVPAFWYSIKEQIIFPKIIRDSALDLIHFPHFNVPFFCPIPYVVTIHDLIIHRYPTTRDEWISRPIYWAKHVIYKMLMRRTVTLAGRIITPSHEVKKDLIALYPEANGKIRVTYEGISAFTTDVNIPAVYRKYQVKSPYILYVGSMYPHKNIPVLLQAYQLLKKQDPQAPTLVLLGKHDYFLDKMVRLAQKMGIEKSVLFPSTVDHSYLSDADLSAFYRGASIVVFPSLQEGFGLPPLEAMSFGVPVASSNVSCMPEILGDAAIYFDPKDVSQMAGSMQQLLKDSHLRQIYTDRGYEQVRKYNWAQMARQTRRVYDEVLRKES